MPKNRRNPSSSTLLERLGSMAHEAPERWQYLPYDQLHERLLAQVDGSVGAHFIESSWKAGQRPYHRQKLALILANQRHFALELAEKGIPVDYRFSDRPYEEVLEEAAEELGALTVNEPAERELRHALAKLIEAGILEARPHPGWLTTNADFEDLGDPPWRMDAFYRRVRKRTGYLMEDGKPTGGKFSFDAENRKAWSGEPKAPEPPRFEPDEITCEVAALIEERFCDHPGQVDLEHLPATRDDAQELWRWAKKHCLEHFGPFEDAMSVHSSGLFHTRLSPLLNLHRLWPAEILEDVLDADLPLPSKEGFLRQVIGWREFVRHVHRASDGFRTLPDQKSAPAKSPGDGGWKPATGKAWKSRAPTAPGGARPGFLSSDGELPAAYWGDALSGLHCLDRVVQDVWREGWSHHITRLMVLSNIATLLDVSPRALTDWFWVAYIDAFDWVVEPNVLAMGTFATGDLMTTKPYVSGAAYIDRMSDYCGECAFDPKKTCPITSLYWSFLERHRNQLEGNHRLALPLKSCETRAKEKKRRDEMTFDIVRRALTSGEAIVPEDLE
ncbi:MAG: cryptochrome/photolyase family protein [Planctomycetota bacterium]